VSSSSITLDEVPPDPLGARLRGRLSDAATAFAGTFADPSMRRAQLSFGLICAAEWAFMIALSVVAYGDGGARAVALVTTLVLVPAALLAPLATTLADRFARDRILVVTGLICMAASAAVAAAVAAGAGPVLTYGPAVLMVAAFTVVRPAHTALLPALCQTPRQLTGAAVVRGMMDSLATLCGPALAAVGLALAGSQAVFAGAAVAAACSALLMARVSYERPQRCVGARLRLGRDAIEGVAALVQHRDAAFIVGIALAQTFTRGCLGVLTVLMAIDLLGSGEAGVGVLTSAIGAGAVVGSLGAGMLAGSRSLARWEGVGTALWGLPLVACAVFPQPLAVLVFLAAVGVGNALVDVGLFTLPTRIVPEALVGRVFGVFESLAALTVALGSLTAPLLVSAFGIRGALLAAGMAAPICVLLVWPRLRRIDRAMVGRESEIALLRAVPMLRLLPLPAIEGLANAVEPSVVERDAIVFEQGERGDRFYVIGAGEAEVLLDGERLCVLSTGDAFGEIALLGECPRTATVRALTELRLHAVASDAFVRAVTGHRPAATEAAQTVQRKLHSDDLRRAAALVTG
jgi:CRP-like cAMP-binding protein